MYEGRGQLYKTMSDNARHRGNTMNKRLILIAIIFLLIAIAVFLFVSRQREAGLTGLTPSPTLAPPAPSGIFPQPTNAVFSFASPPGTPSTAPSYTFVPPTLASIESMVGRSAQALDLSSTPSSLIRDGVYTKTWSRPGEAKVVVTQKNNAIGITFQQAKSSQPPGVFTPDVAVQQFLLSLVPISPGITVYAAGSSSGPFDGLLVLDTPSPSSYKNYLFSYAVDQKPILTSALSLTPVSVIADSGGIIRSASIVPPPTAVQAAVSLALLSPEQILASLAAGRGTLLDVHNPQTPEQGELPAFSAFTITDVKIVYAPQNNMLLPAFYLSGTGTAPAGKAQQAIIFLWAFQEGAKTQL